MIVSQQAKWALSQIENALLKRDELSALNQVNTYITQLEERVKVLEQHGTEMIKHDGCEGCEDWHMLKFHDAREKFRAALAGGKVGA